MAFDHNAQQRGGGIGAIGDGTASVLLTDKLHDVSQLFDPSHRGRGFTILRHPFARELSKYQYLLSTRAIPETLTFLDWIKTARHNNLVRVLTNDPIKPLTDQHVDAAKEIIRRKLLVGFADNLHESFRRFAQYFRWPVDQKHMDCVQLWLNHVGHPVPSDVEAEALAQTQWADLELYEYALSIFEDQTALIEDAQAPQIKKT